MMPKDGKNVSLCLLILGGMYFTNIGTILRYQKRCFAGGILLFMRGQFFFMPYIAKKLPLNKKYSFFETPDGFGSPLSTTQDKNFLYHAFHYLNESLFKRKSWRALYAHILFWTSFLIFSKR